MTQSQKRKAVDKAALCAVCPFKAIEVADGELAINAGCRMCRICVKKHGDVFEFVDDALAMTVDKSLWRGIAVVAEIEEGNIHPVTFELLGKARQLAQKAGFPVYSLVIGHNITAQAQKILEYDADEVFVYDQPELEQFRIEPYTAVLEDFINRVKPSSILVGGTQTGRSLAPRAAARFRTGLTADCTVLDMDNSADAYLLLTFDGAGKAEVEPAWEEAAEICLQCGALDVFISATQERNDAIWSARGAFLEAIKGSTTEMDECDVVVPRRHVAEFVMYSHDLQQTHQIRIRSFGHAGDGNLHIYILRDGLDEAAWEKKLAEVFADLYLKAAELGGKVSGEHGIGYAKRPYLAESLSPMELQLMRGIKQVFDPQNILNPDKVIPVP